MKDIGGQEIGYVMENTILEISLDISQVRKALGQNMRLCF